jgi:hypothetical protein
VETNTDAQVRIARIPDGFWSYLGTDIMDESIGPNEQTMNLDAFTRFTEDSEYIRVVRHEAGHTLGFPHEHMRAELIELIDREKAIDHFMQTQGWSRQEVINQVLTPLEESSLLGTDNAEEDSIMCYQISGDITVNGDPINGGTDITESDAAFAGKIYPKPKTPRTLSHDHEKAGRLICCAVSMLSDSQVLKFSLAVKRFFGTICLSATRPRPGKAGCI